MVAMLEEVLHGEEGDIEVEEVMVGYQIGESIVNYVENQGTLSINATIGLTKISKGILLVRIFRIFPLLILGHM